jgi:GTP-binding protein EngB required for normal cell division
VSATSTDYGSLAGAQHHPDPAVSHNLEELLDRATTCIDAPAASQAKILERLNALHERLATERFQLAVLGQFKRGKSTVLNALLGQSVLPIGVVPVTAIPTFLESAATSNIRVTYVSGKVEEFEPKGTEALREKLTMFVTEEANPRNALNVAQVDVCLPAELLERGVVLIDTPGVGSTHRHQTAAADAVLPECDAALFVVSADPPITEIEIDYLARIRETVARLIVVLNKIDNVESHERAKADDERNELTRSKDRFHTGFANTWLRSLQPCYQDCARLLLNGSTRSRGMKQRRQSSRRN